MLDAGYICENVEAVKANCKNRNVADFPVDRVVAFEAERKRLERLRGETAAVSNDHSKKFSQKMTDEEKAAFKARGVELKNEVATIDAQLKIVADDLLLNLVQIPNMTHPDAPVGTTDADNKVVSVVGEPRKFDF